jgi:hypothetical protein
MLLARHGDIKQTRQQNMAEIVFSWGVMRGSNQNLDIPPWAYLGNLLV